MKSLSVQMIMNGRRQAAQGRFLKSGVIRRCLTLGLAAGLLLAMVSSAQAAAAGSTVDQQQIVGSSLSFSARGPMAQTFTAGLNNPTFTAGMRGNLDHVTLELYNPYGTVTVSIHTVSANQPTNTQIGPTSSAGYLPCCLRPTDFWFSTPIPITSGVQYAIVVVPGGAPLTWYQISGTSTYPSGKMWLGSGGSWYGQSYETTFKTWVATAASNSPLTIKPNLDTVQVKEGAVPTAGGTYSDTDGNTVTLSASALAGPAGTVTGAAGTWSWTGVAADEGQGQTITITADDGHGNQAQAQFSTVVIAVLPTATISGAPSSVNEGKSVTLTASATSPSAEDTAAGFTFNWTATEYGKNLPAHTGSTYTLTTDDEGVYVITLTATDESGHVSPQVSVTINGVDPKPAASIIGVPQAFVIVPQQTLSFTGTFTDAGSIVDTSYTTTWSWGDGSPNSAGNNPTHAFGRDGTYTVTYTAADDDGTAGSATTTVTVLTPAAALAKLTGFVSGQSGLNKGQMNSLLAKLNAANDSWQRGDAGPACNQLNAFVNEVDADQKAGRISGDAAATMTDAARVTQRSMGCFRTLVEFLSGL